MVSVTGAQRLSHQRRTPRPRTSTRARQLERSTGCTLQAELDAFETQCDAVLSCLAVSYTASTLKGATLTVATGCRMKHALYFALVGTGPATAGGGAAARKGAERSNGKLQLLPSCALAESLGEALWLPH